ncbi:O-antigen polymerase [Escherichia albertii]|uniref:O-antigen polymerase n=1 Tax=Escherichia albertii TaxID=208962 RepID=A0A5A4U9C5_ESCAL|nr:EpsG family protein [Escherichia albertii]BAT35575.1 O-antigen polymerase [Escherichia albertii]BBM62301.1 O-antigen polymerase [Escherichia albertii]
MLFTYASYLCILMFSTSVAFCYEHSKSNFKVFLWSVLFLSLWVPAAIRFGVGADYFRYLSMVESVRLGYISTEIGFYFINYIVVWFDLNPQWSIAISSFIVIFLSLKAIPRNYFTISVFVLVCTFYLPSFSLVRQAIAIAFIAYAVKYYIDGNKKNYIVFVLIGSLFHLSALLLLPIYFVARFRVRSSILFLGILIISLLLFLGSGLNTLLNSELFLQSKYGYYATSDFIQDAKIGSGIGVLIKMLLPLMFIINAKKILKTNQNLNILLWMSVGCVLANVCSMKIHIFNRLADTFLFVNFMVSSYIIASLEKNVIKQLYSMGIIIVFIVFYCRTIQANYNDDLGGIGISPYKTIFYK